MARQRRSYTRKFKIEAVKLLPQKGYSVAEAARSLAIGEDLRPSRKHTFETGGEQASPGPGNLPALQEEMRQRRTEHKRLEMERDNQAMAFSAKDAR